MRRLMIKLVAIETALVGWLSYWLFLVYATNPAIASALAEKLARFPQLSFTTIDISVLIAIGILAILLALKFQRGLRPGIRLERALQMLETLMKRNLFLESQVAELKLDRGNISQPQIPRPTAPSPSGEQAGSWERAFRIPIEAGPVPSTVPARPPMTPQASTFERQSLPRPPAVSRSETKPQPPPVVAQKTGLSIPEVQDATKFEPETKPRVDEKTRTFGPAVTPTSWEDSPKRIAEVGILSPAQDTRAASSVMPDSSEAKPPLPAPGKLSPPQGVVIGGPVVSPRSERNPFRRMLQLPVNLKPGQVGAASPSSSGFKPVPVSTPTMSQETKVDTEVRPTIAEDKTPSIEEATLKDEGPDSEKVSEKPPGKARPVFRKRFTFDDEEEHR